MNTVIATQQRYDAVVIGARVAGAATAMLLARAGLRVLAVDRAAEGRDTLSTHALMRPGVALLHRWGLLDRLLAAGTPPLRTTTFHYGDESVAVRIKQRDGVDALFAPRRTVLDPILAGAAREAGAEVVYGVRAGALLRGADGRVTGVTLETDDGLRQDVRAGIVIGADGIRSTVASQVEAPIVHEGRHATASVYGYFRGLGVEGNHWYFRPGIGVGAIPTNDGDTCVFVSVPAARLRAARDAGRSQAAFFDEALAEGDPAFARLVTGAERQGVFHAFPGQAGYLREAAGPGWALVGDAGFFKDPLTAHGMTDALRDAELLAQAVIAGTEAGMRGYRAARDDMAREMLDVTDAIASFAWDLDEVKALHLRLSEHMTREQEFVAGFGVRFGAATRPAGAPARTATVLPAAA